MSTTRRMLFVLGASDPEMSEIEAAVLAAGHEVVYATVNGVRVHPGNAYKANGTILGGIAHVVRVECGGAATVACDPINDGEDFYGHALNECVSIDHHFPGDPGFGRAPIEFMDASSLGQVLALLGMEPTERQRLVAAADHCLGAAYRGECPGVNPDALAAFRAAERAAFQKRPAAEVLADIDAAVAALNAAPRIDIGGGVEVADMRRPEPVAELMEAGTRTGTAYIAGPLVDPRDGRQKYTVSGEAAAAAFLAGGAAALGLVDTYGDPARGFAGGYAPAA